MNNEQKLFAFKLAAKQDKKQEPAKLQAKWKGQEGVSVAGCTTVRIYFERYSGAGIDGGVYC